MERNTKKRATIEKKVEEEKKIVRGRDKEAVEIVLSKQKKQRKAKEISCKRFRGHK